MLDHEQKIGMIVPNGKHIKKAIMGMFDKKGYLTEEWQNGLLHVDINNEPMSLTFQHQVDVIGQVSRGIFAGGFVGSERRAEHEAYLDEKGLLPKYVEIGRFQLFPPRLRLSFLVRDNPVDNKRFKTTTDLRDTRIVTGCPTLAARYLERYFRGEQLPVDIDMTNGGEEGQVYARVADAALVVVDRGKTMRDHFLRELKGGPVMTGIYVSAIANIEFLRDRGNRMLLEQAMHRLQNGGRSRTGFVMPHLPDPDTVEVSENGQKPDDVIVPEKRSWLGRIFQARKGSAVALSTLPVALLMSLFTLPNPSAILNSWRSRISK